MREATRPGRVEHCVLRQKLRLCAQLKNSMGVGVASLEMQALKSSKAFFIESERRCLTCWFSCKVMSVSVRMKHQFLDLVRASVVAS